jgi:hypothetical protein
MHFFDLFWRTSPEIRSTFHEQEHLTSSRQPRIWLVALTLSILVAIFQIGNHLMNQTDYVGLDPDDTMRLVQVRDFLAGQGWFDMHQYRLGLDGGTLMHWSRLVDLPIALLIRFFSLFTDSRTAEMLALFVWPISLTFPFLAAMGLACHRLGGRAGLVAGLGFSTLMVLEIARFRPGSIDHTNVQIVLIAIIAAMLIDPARRASNFAIAGIASGLALAIGAETTPLIAMVAMIVALLWASLGDAYRPAALAYCASLGATTALLFFLTTPASLYTAVTCDNLSFGYLVMTMTGAGLLLLGVALMPDASPASRFVTLAVVGAAVGVLALLLMPQCIRNPLGDLDPMLKQLWLDNVSEAQSILQMLKKEPALIGSFFAVGFLGIIVAVFRIVHGNRVVAHAILLGMIAMAFLVTVIQIRGMVFSNLLGIIVMSAFVADMRELHYRDKKNVGVALAFVLIAYMSAPSAWTFAGAMTMKAKSWIAGDAGKKEEGGELNRLVCADEKVLAPIAGLPPGRIMAQSNIGSALLRFTPHGVVAAPYHRNQAGMLAEMKAATASPEEAESIIRAAGVTIVVFCRRDPQGSYFARKFPDGLYASLIKGRAPAYLEHQPKLSNSDIAIFRLKPAS